MDIVYIIGKNKSKCGHLEFKCSLRALEQYGVNVGKVFVVGSCPDWLSDEVIKIPYEQPWEGKTCDEKNANIMASVLYAAQDPRVGKHFLVSMDDHMLSDYVDFDENTYPIYTRRYFCGEGYKKTYLPSVHTENMPEYTHFLVDSCLRLKERGLDTINFTLHRNMHIWKDIILQYKDDIENMVARPAPVEVFAYMGNLALKHNVINESQFVPAKDVKLLNGVKDWYKTNSQYKFFSTADFTYLSPLYILLKCKYSHKSKYEK